MSLLDDPHQASDREEDDGRVDLDHDNAAEYTLVAAEGDDEHAYVSHECSKWQP